MFKPIYFMIIFTGISDLNKMFIFLKLITGAGHHVYADRPNEFNDYVKYILELIDEHERSNQEYPNATNQSNNCSSNSMPD